MSEHTSKALKREMSTELMAKIIKVIKVEDYKGAQEIARVSGFPITVEELKTTFPQKTPKTVDQPSRPIPGGYGQGACGQGGCGQGACGQGGCGQGGCGQGASKGSGVGPKFYYYNRAIL